MANTGTPRGWDKMRQLTENEGFEFRLHDGKDKYPVPYIHEIPNPEMLSALCDTMILECKKLVSQEHGLEIPAEQLLNMRPEKVLEEGFKRVASVYITNPAKWPKGKGYKEYVDHVQKLAIDAFSDNPSEDPESIKAKLRDYQEANPEYHKKHTAKLREDRALQEAMSASSIEDL